jgi:DNA-binding winged helix-turn-helix (wHTH) protein/Tfp pilus assembly protein PilF
MSFQVGAFDVEASRNVLTHGAIQIALEPKIMDVLCALATHRGEVMSRGALIAQVWGVQFGGDESLSRAISILRKTFAEAGERERYIETISKRGYQLVQPVHELGTAREPPVKRHVVADGYSVAVIPLECAGGKAERLLADDVGRDLVASLSSAPHLRVASYEPALRDRSEPAAPEEIGWRLNVRYVVSGSLRRRRDRLMLRFSLIDAGKNTHLMSWRFTPAADQVQAQLEDFILELSTPIISEIQISEGSRAHIEPDGRRDAYRIIQSTEMLRALYSERRAREIVEHLRDLIGREPDNAEAQGSLAIQLAQNVTNGWTETPAATMEEARRLIDDALAIAPNDADVLLAAGIVPAMAGEAASAIHYLARSLERNPNNPHALAVLGWQTCLSNGDERGIQMIRAAERRAPHHPRYSIWATYRATCEMKLGRWEAASESYRQAIERNPNYQINYIGLAGVLATLKQDAEARLVVDHLLMREPSYSSLDLSNHFARWAHVFPDSVSAEDCAAGVRRIWPR